MNNKYQLTREKIEQLQEEKRQLLEEREQNVISIQEARSQGDLSENADYDAARNEQARIASRLIELDTILKNYEIIDESDSDDEYVRMGKWVRVVFEGIEDEAQDDDFNGQQVYKIVGTLEADPIKRFISNESPFGAAIMYHQVNDRVYVKPEEGEEFYVTILEISGKEIN